METVRRLLMRARNLDHPQRYVEFQNDRFFASELTGWFVAGQTLLGINNDGEEVYHRGIAELEDYNPYYDEYTVTFTAEVTYQGAPITLILMSHLPFVEVWRAAQDGRLTSTNPEEANDNTEEAMME